jgi:hypothetical protein
MRGPWWHPSSDTPGRRQPHRRIHRDEHPERIVMMLRCSIAGRAVRPPVGRARRRRQPGGAPRRTGRSRCRLRGAGSRSRPRRVVTTERSQSALTSASVVSVPDRSDAVDRRPTTLFVPLVVPTPGPLAGTGLDGSTGRPPPDDSVQRGTRRGAWNCIFCTQLFYSSTTKNEHTHAGFDVRTTPAGHGL